MSASLPTIASALSEAVCRGDLHAGRVKSRGKAPCQSINCARSGRAADAVRERSTDAPTRRDRAGFVVGLFVLLTPARWDARKLAGQSRRDIGAGVRFCSRTDQNRHQNQQAIEISTQSARFSRFCDFASRDVRAYVCAITRVSRARVLPEPQNHSAFPFINKGLLVLEPVLVGSASEPHGVIGAASTLFRRFSNKLAGGYAGHALLTGCRGSFRAAVGESFGVLEAGAAPIGGLGERIGSWASASGENGGFPAFSTRPSRAVGSAMLEGMAQSAGFPPFLTDRRKPVRLEGRGGSIDRPAPPAPPSAAARLPSMASPEACQIWAEHRAGKHDGSMTVRLDRDPRNLNRPMGTGEKSIPSCARRRGALGRRAAAWLQRRVFDDTGRRCHVN